MKKMVVGYVVVGNPNTDDATECRDCGFDAILAFPLTLISEAGVSPAGFHLACGRCWEERQA